MSLMAIQYMIRCSNGLRYGLRWWGSWSFGTGEWIRDCHCWSCMSQGCPAIHSMPGILRKKEWCGIVSPPKTAMNQKGFTIWDCRKIPQDLAWTNSALFFCIRDDAAGNTWSGSIWSSCLESSWAKLRHLRSGFRKQRKTYTCMPEMDKNIKSHGAVEEQIDVWYMHCRDVPGNPAILAPGWSALCWLRTARGLSKLFVSP